MPSYMLVNATGIAGKPFQLGYPVTVRWNNQIGGKQVPPKFIQVEITDDDNWESLELAYCREWNCGVDWDFIGHDWGIDGHRLKVWMLPEFVSASGQNSITRNQVEFFLNRWLASVVSVGQNEVTFDTRVYSAICSPGFWGKDNILVTVGFAENSYDSATGIHSITANYSNDPILSSMPSIKIEELVASRGGTVTKHNTAQDNITFFVNRSTVFDTVKLEVKQALQNQTFRVRKWKIPEAYVQMALDNEGTISVTKQQLINYIHNMLED